VLIFRYLAKEVFITLVSLTAILLLVFMSNQFVQYLNRAVSGQFPVFFVMKLMLLEMPGLMGLLLPLGFYMAIMLAYGRLYAESEMTVLNACGYGPGALLRQSLIMAAVVALFVMVIMLWLSPYISIERTSLLRQSGLQMLMKTLVPGQFRAISGGEQVFYVESMSQDKGALHHVFLAKWDTKEGKSQWDVLWAKDAFIQNDPQTREDYAILEEGSVYQGKPGQADYQVVNFGRYKARLPHPFTNIHDDVRTAFTANLWPINNHDLAKAAELQWRFSVPLMVLILTLIAVPLSRVDPRSGKYAKLFPAILIYIIYANLLFVSRGWVASGKIPPWLGMWSFHLVFVLLGGVLIWRSRVKLS
jgi:lipopolysaccharide export system permease protein